MSNSNRIDILSIFFRREGSTYKSWLAIQKNLRHRVDGKQRWLNVVKSDRELHELSGSNLDVIKQKAQEILDRLNAVTNEVVSASNAKKRKKAKQKAKSSNDDNLISKLFNAYDDTDDILSHCAISHLLKNDCKVSEIEEDPDGFTHRIHWKKEQIEQLEAELNARLPKSRDLSGAEFLETLELATYQISENVAQAKEWDAKLRTKSASLPYPIIYESAEEVRWGKTEMSWLC